MGKAARPIRGWLLAAVLAAGCGGAPKRVEFPARPESSFVFLYVDMDDAPTNVGAAELRQVRPPSETPIFGLRVDDGVLYRESMAPGSYAVTWLSSGPGFYVFSTPTEYEVGRQGNPMRVDIDQPGVYFIGAFAYRDAGGGVFTQAKFEIVPYDGIGEKEALGRILKHVEGTPWESRVRAHYNSL